MGEEPALRLTPSVRMVLLAALFAVLAACAYRWNHALFLTVNGLNHPAVDRVLGLVSGLGDGLVVSLLCTILALFYLRGGLAALAAFIASGLLAQLLKHLLEMPRPPAVFGQSVHLLGDALYSHSFPSGHATSAGVLVLAPFLIWSWCDWRPWSVAPLFLAAAYGRIYGGVHFPFDVVVGLGLGLACMWACWQWSRRWPLDRWQASHWTWRVLFMLVLIQAAVLGLGYHMQPTTAQPLTMVLPVAALLIMMSLWKDRFGNPRSL